MARITTTADLVTWDAFEQPRRKTRDYVASVRSSSTVTNTMKPCGP
ncbi:hypothetical protein AB0P15_37390 [Streptomyces sp. NPDC087917]